MEPRQNVSPRKFEDMRFLIAIKAVYQRSRGTYDPKKIRDKLARQGGFEYIGVFYNRIRCHVKMSNQVLVYFTHQFTPAGKFCSTIQMTCPSTKLDSV